MVSDMHWKGFIVGFGLAAAVGVGACVWLVQAMDRANADILMGHKTFFDYGDQKSGNGYVSFSGSIGGVEPLAARNNIFSATCIQDEGVCRTANVQQIGNLQISDIDTGTFLITEWGQDKIVAESGPDLPVCVRIALIIHRKSEIIEYVRSPRETSDELCKSVEKRTIGWTIEDGLTAARKRLNKSK